MSAKSRADLPEFGKVDRRSAPDSLYEVEVRRPPEGHTGLHHVAFVYPDRSSLSRAVKRVLRHGIELVHKADHAVSEAVYFHDPDHNLLEIYGDWPRSQWPTNPDGT